MNDACGASVTVIICEAGALAPHGFEATSVTVYVPAAAKERVGFCVEEVFPSPKSHAQAVGEFVEVSVKFTACPAQTLEADIVKPATGAGGAMEMLCEIELAPQAFVTVSATI